MNAGSVGTPASGETRPEPSLAVALGRATAAASIALAVGGLLLLAAIGRTDHIVEGYVAHLGLPAVGFGALAWVAIPRQPDNRAVWVMAWAALCTALGTAGWAAAISLSGAAGFDTSYVAWGRLSPSEVPPAAAVAWILIFVGAVPGYFSVLTLGMLLGPDGELASPRLRWVGRGAVATMAALTVVLAWRWWPGTEGGYGSDPAVGTGGFVDALLLVLTLLAAVSIGSLVVRYRRSHGPAREQCRWIGLGTGALLGMFVVSSLAELVPGLASSGFERAAFLVGLGVLVACFGIAVTRYRLYDIDVVVSRALSYGVLAAFIGAVYVVVVVMGGLLVDSAAGSLVLSVLAMSLAAIGFEPLRQFAQRRADRLVYGDRATPYQVLSDLVSRLAGTESADRVLDRMANLIADATRADQATIWLRDGDRFAALAGWPARPAAGVTASAGDLPGVVRLAFQDGQAVGVLQVVKRRGEPLTSAEDRLLHDLAGSAGLVLGNHRLTAALTARAAEQRASRRRLVEAEHVERRRLERDLHEGAQRRVEVLNARIRTIEPTVRGRGGGRVADLLLEVHSDLHEVVGQIDAFARGIYPPLLHSGGLAAALGEQVSALPIPVAVDVEARRYSPDVESALYFAAMEAVANAVKHGAPSRVSVHVAAGDREVAMTIADDGTGFDPTAIGEGAGLANIRDRIEALGGTVRFRSVRGTGVKVTARVPLGHADSTGTMAVLRPVPGAAG